MNDRVAADDSLSSYPSVSQTLDSSVAMNDRVVADDSLSSDPSVSQGVSSSRLNARAPEFVPQTSNRTDLAQPLLVIPQGPGPMHVFPSPTSPFHVPVQNHVPYPYYGGFVEHEVQAQASVDPDPLPVVQDGLTEEAALKILNQVEYYFSDANLATTDHLIRFISKDPEGFVPISVVASFKKIKALISNHSQLAAVLRTSSKLIVSEDGKKVRRQNPLTESDIEELQSRIVVAENLPEDHSYQKLMKIFSAIGSVKTIRTCPPQASNGGSSAASRVAKSDNMLFSNKLHAFVVYETVELAEKAVAELNDERNWRSGLRVRLMARRMAKSQHARGKKFAQEDVGNEEGDTSTSEHTNEKQSNSSQQVDVSTQEHAGDEHINEEGGPKRGHGRGRGKGRGRGQHHHNNRGNHVGTPPLNNLALNEQPTVTKQPPGPRMPDGTRGFTMGRGKPVVVGST